ncbi:hypothetical protein LF1_10710 [Rubripirellula obstinata]|uniref:Uncharacterized protein n=1 Tax=Rubripirellula obstinata TaxID=406547 RepID=A0A5B1CEA5_9BACT|nr:hypothetical protein LF1_10710 [Rubripirellula obstinata]
MDEAGLLACSMYVDLNPVRAAMAGSPDDSIHTSAYDRIEAEKGKQIPSAAFDLKAIPAKEAGRKIRETSVEELKQERKEARKNPTGRKVRRDGWLAPLSMTHGTLESDPEVHQDGFRGSDKGFLNIDWKDYKRLLRWTARQGVEGVTSKVPSAMAKTLQELGIDALMWRDLVWNWQKYFGKSSCVGRPESMKADAERIGHHHHRGQASVAECFAIT